MVKQTILNGLVDIKPVGTQDSVISVSQGLKAVRKGLKAKRRRRPELQLQHERGRKPSHRLRLQKMDLLIRDDTDLIRGLAIQYNLSEMIGKKGACRIPLTSFLRFYTFMSCTVFLVKSSFIILHRFMNEKRVTIRIT